MDAPRRRSTRRYSGLQRCQRQARIDAATDRIANDTARPGIEDRGEIHEAPCDRDVGDVGHPELVRTRRRDLLGQVGEYRPIMIAVRGEDVAARRMYTKAGVRQTPD